MLKCGAGLDQPHVTMIQIDRLGRDKATAMIRNLAGSKELPTEVLEVIVSKTDGVPLFVEELTKMVLDPRPLGRPYPGPITNKPLLARMSEIIWDISPIFLVNRFIYNSLRLWQRA
jgi:hypothetical protein